MLRRSRQLGWRRGDTPGPPGPTPSQFQRFPRSRAHRHLPTMTKSKLPLQNHLPWKTTPQAGAQASARITAPPQPAKEVRPRAQSLGFEGLTTPVTQSSTGWCQMRDPQEATCGDRGASHSARIQGPGGLLTGKQPRATCHCAWGNLVPLPTHWNSTIQRSCPKGQCLHQDLWPQFSYNGG